MLLAASESAVTKKPRLRLTMSRSSSVTPFGFFQRAMSRFMLISCGIQWLAQPERYFSHAHLYLNGTSWFTSVRALMTRLSSARTRVEGVGAGVFVGPAGGALAGAVIPDGVEWRSWRPSAAGCAGCSSSKLSILFLSPVWRWGRATFGYWFTWCCGAANWVPAQSRMKRRPGRKNGYAATT